MSVTLLHRKERVVLTAIDIIDQLGIQALSTREIARRQGISEGTLFKHFKSKSEIILAVLDYFCQYDNDLMETAKVKSQSPDEAIRFIFNIYATYYENYPAITVIPQIYSILNYDRDLHDKIQEVIQSRFNFIKDLVEQSQEQGLMRKSVSSEVITDIIEGSAREVCFHWRMGGYQFSLKDRILQTLETILKLFKEQK